MVGCWSPWPLRRQPQVKIGDLGLSRGIAVDGETGEATRLEESAKHWGWGTLVSSAPMVSDPAFTLETLNSLDWLMEKSTLELLYEPPIMAVSGRFPISEMNTVCWWQPFRLTVGAGHASTGRATHRVCGHTLVRCMLRCRSSLEVG